MNFDDPCPQCGHKRKPYMMATNSDAPGFRELLKHQGDPIMQTLAWIGLLVILFLITLQIFIWIL